MSLLSSSTRVVKVSSPASSHSPCSRSLSGKISMLTFAQPLKSWKMLTNGRLLGLVVQKLKYLLLIGSYVITEAALPSALGVSLYKVTSKPDFKIKG